MDLQFFIDNCQSVSIISIWIYIYFTEREKILQKKKEKKFDTNSL